MHNFTEYREFFDAKVYSTIVNISTLYKYISEYPNSDDAIIIFNSLSSTTPLQSLCEILYFLYSVYCTHFLCELDRKPLFHVLIQLTFNKINKLQIDAL